MATTNGEAAPVMDKQQVKDEAHHLINGTSNGDVQVNNWSEPGPAAFDFRSTSIPTKPYYHTHDTDV